MQSRLSGQVPQVAAVMGGLGGDPALEVPLCDFKLITKRNGMLATGGPPLVKAALGLDISKEDLGGHKVAIEPPASSTTPPRTTRTASARSAPT